MIGRCLRPQPGKRAVVLDHVGNTLRLGHHLEPREWSLDGVAKRDREQAPSVKVCPQCFATSPSQAQVCSECGHEFRAEVRELKVVEGELQEVVRGAKMPLAGPYKVGDVVNDFWRVSKILEDGWMDFEDDNFEWRAHESEVTFTSRPDPRREQGSARDLQSLRELAKQRGYKPGWAERVYQARLAKR